jgi:uncharacterized membrane protein
MTRHTSDSADQPVPVQAPGIVLGIGLGGFFDGIFLHQIFQWHHMFSSLYPVDTVPGLRMNTLGDGLFHTVTWLAVLIGLGMLYSRVTEARRRVWGSRVLWGWMLVRWGIFNLVEGLVDHQLLGVHHVHSGPHNLPGTWASSPSGWRWSWWAGWCSAALVLAGCLYTWVIAGPDPKPRTDGRFPRAWWYSV